MDCHELQSTIDNDYYLKWNKASLVSRGNTRSSVPDGLVCDSEFGKVHANHFWLHFHTTEHLSIVNTNDGSDHFWDNDHVSKVGLDTTGLFAWRCLLLGLSQTLNEGHGLALEPTGHTTTGTGGDQVHQLVVRQVQELFKLNSTESELLELTLLTKLSNFLGIHLFSHLD